MLIIRKKMSDSDVEFLAPPELRDMATSATMDWLPDRSKEVREKTHNIFAWCSSKLCRNIASENKLLVFFETEK